MLALNLVVGDRPAYVKELLHRKLFTRAQHVVAADRKRHEGQLSNMMITHGTISDCTDIRESCRYAAFIEHCLRAELKLLAWRPIGLSNYL